VLRARDAMPVPVGWSLEVPGFSLMRCGSFPAARMERERSRGLGCDVPIADSAPLSAVEWAAVTKRRSAGSGLLPRDQMRAWMSAAKAVGCVPVGVLGWTGLVVSSRYRRNARGLLACSV
jgi:hypothetical protein